MKTTVETEGLGNGDDTGDLASGDWRRHWSLIVGGVENNTGAGGE